MDERSFITEIRQIFALAPKQRLQAMISFHHKVCEAYCSAVNAIDSRTR